MIGIRDAVIKAMAYAQEVLGEERTRGLRLEEVESAGSRSGRWRGSGPRPGLDNHSQYAYTS